MSLTTCPNCHRLCFIEIEACPSCGVVFASGALRARYASEEKAFLLKYSVLFVVIFLLAMAALSFVGLPGAVGAS